VDNEGKEFKFMSPQKGAPDQLGSSFPDAVSLKLAIE